MGISGLGTLEARMLWVHFCGFREGVGSLIMCVTLGFCVSVFVSLGICHGVGQSSSLSRLSQSAREGASRGIRAWCHGGQCRGVSGEQKERVPQREGRLRTRIPPVLLHQKYSFQLCHENSGFHK